MKDSHEICIGMALAMSWLTRSAWRRQDSGVEHIFDIDQYIALAQRAERAKLDFMFSPDTLFLAKEAVEYEAGFSGFDPTPLIASVASHTNKIGLVSTISTTFTPPYIAARQLQSLSWLSQGRAGWNIVTALGGNENFGLGEMPTSQERYHKASEFVDVVTKLWQSYPYQSVKADKKTGQFADLAYIDNIDHHGEHFDVQGPLNIPSHPTGRMPFFQAGASDSGRDFAARVADVMFAATPDIEAGLELKQDLAKRCLAHGRQPYQLKVLPGVALYLADSKEEAYQLFESAHKDIDKARYFSYLEKNLGIDFSTTDLDEVIHFEMLPKEFTAASQTHANLLTRYIKRESPTLKTLLSRPEVIGASHWLIVGTVEEAFNEIVERIKLGAADGIIAVPAGSIHSVDLFFDHLIPKLQSQGWFKSEYKGNTLAEHIQG